jgi:hypothetical protein
MDMAHKLGTTALIGRSCRAGAQHAAALRAEATIRQLKYFR